MVAKGCSGALIAQSRARRTMFDSLFWRGIAECRNSYLGHLKMLWLFCLAGFLEFFVFISSAFAQTAPAATAGGDLTSFITSQGPFLLVMIAVMYFMMIRPQMKKQKEHRNMLAALAKGDEVVTGGGLLGKVSKIGDAYVGLEVANGVEVQIQREAIVQVLPKGSIK